MNDQTGPKITGHIATGTFQEIIQQSSECVTASETDDSLPDIQTAIDEHAGVKEIAVTGGRNAITEPIRVHNHGMSIGELPMVGLRTAPGSYITQPDGADLETLVDVRKSRSTIDVAVDGNRSNQSEPVTGVTHVQNGKTGQARVRAMHCDTGIVATGQTECYEFSVTGQENGTLARTAPSGEFTEASQPSNQNYWTVRGDHNETDFHNDSGAHVWASVYSEQCKDTSVINGGVLFVDGIVRRTRDAFRNDDGHLYINGGFFSGSGTFADHQTGSGPAVVSGCRLYDFDTGLTNPSNRPLIVSDTTFVNVDTAFALGDTSLVSQANQVVFDSVGQTTTRENDRTRLVKNGVATNPGDPRTTGRWRGNGDDAFELGAQIYDTQHDAWYFPLATGGWARLGA